MSSSVRPIGAEITDQAELALALDVDKSSVARRAKKEGWEFSEKPCRGGKRRLYTVESLPPEATTKLALLRHKESPAGSSSAGEPGHPSQADGRSSLAAPGAAASKRQGEAAAPTYSRESLWARFEQLPQRLKERARWRLAVIDTAMRLIDGGTPRRDAWNTVAKEAGKGRATVQRWYRRCKNYDRTDWLPALADGYVGRTAKAEFDDAAWDYVRADYLRLEAPAAAACYERLKMAAAEHGWQIPSQRTVERRLANIPTPIQVLHREGEGALMALYPAMQRSVRDLHALEWINGDGYQHNVFVRWPDGTIARPKTWMWQDIFSRKFLAWRTDKSENTDVIRLAFLDLIQRYGIPHHVTIDNTRAAANKWMTGGVANRYRFKVREDDPLGLIPSICGPDSLHWTSVHQWGGHGQAKPVERSFGWGGLGEYVDKHPALAGAYTGRDTTSKPENYGDRAIPLAEFLEILNQTVRAMNAREKRRTEMAAGVKSYDQVFNDSYAQSAIRKATGEQLRMLMLSAEAVTVGRDGTITLDAGSATGIGRNRYGCDALHEHMGTKVVARFDPQQLHEAVHLYTLDNRYIGQADCIQAAGFGDTEAGRRHNRARREWMRATKAAAAQQQRMSTEEAARLLPDQLESEDVPDTKVIEGVFKRAAGSDLEPDDDESHEESFRRAVRSAPAPWDAWDEP
jgi:hypothetical protein